MKLVHKLRDMSESTPLIDSGTEAYFLIYFSQLHLDTPYPLVVPKTTSNQASLYVLRSKLCICKVYDYRRLCS